MKLRPAILTIVLLLSVTTELHAQWLQDSKELMGTRVSVEIWANDPATGQRAINSALAEIERLDLMMNPWNPASELARINRNAPQGLVTTTPEIMEVVKRALHYSRISDGAFDISFASVGQHYNYREKRRPSAHQLETGRASINYRGIQLDAALGAISFSLAGLQIDLGGIAKGYAVDRSIAILRDYGIEAAVVTAGGDTRILGDLGDRPRTIGIRHPRKKNEFAVMIPLQDTAISTSGDYERFFIKDGIRFHHILDPDTGRSSHGVQSVSVLASRAMDSDALSTTTFVLGVEHGLALINSLAGVDAIVIDQHGKLHYSEGLLLEASTK